MTYAEEWHALASRIRGLMEAAHLYAQFMRVNSGDSYGIAKRLREQGADILAAVRSFESRFRDQLGSTAVAAITRFVSGVEALLEDNTSASAAQTEQAWTALVALGAFETELSFLLADRAQVMRTLSERAFEHLQRAIAADPDVRRKWKDAFNTNEPACERLGAVHLLSHGIWAFKINAARARTDLVFQDAMPDDQRTARCAEGLVLTEWKLCRVAAEARRKFDEARVQAAAYAGGAVPAMELTGYRYLVVVSETEVECPADETDNGVTYRHINIAVEPTVPSRR